MCRRGRGWDEAVAVAAAAAAAGVAEGRPLAVRARRLRRGPQEAARGVNSLGRSQACAGPRLEERGLLRRGECGARCGRGGGRSAARPRRAAGLGPRASRAWRWDASGPGGPGCPTRPRSRAPGWARRRPRGRVAARGVVGEAAGQGGRRRRGVREAGDVGPGPKGSRELGEPQRGRPRSPGEEGCPGSFPAL